MKCLEKDRNRRYATASDLAQEIEHYLRDEPVIAGPPSTWYRFRKYARRNKAGLIAASLVTVALLARTGLATWQAVRATQAQTIAAARLTPGRSLSSSCLAVGRSRRTMGTPLWSAVAIRSSACAAVDGNGCWA
jgi:hypothetical protein